MEKAMKFYVSPFFTRMVDEYPSIIITDFVIADWMKYNSYISDSVHYGSAFVNTCSVSDFAIPESSQRSYHDNQRHHAGSIACKKHFSEYVNTIMKHNLMVFK